MTGYKNLFKMGIPSKTLEKQLPCHEQASVNKFELAGPGGIVIR
jgi:hypothetical protein